MSRVVAGMTMSVDGFVADRDGSAEPLYPDLAGLRGTAYMNDLIEETGAVLMGRRSFEMGDPDTYADNYEFQVPIFVLTHHPPKVPPKRSEHITFTFVSGDVAPAIERAKAAAGDKAVQVVGGPGVIQELLRAGLVDELHLDVMPVVLGGGLRFLDNLDPESVRLEKVDIVDVGQRTSLRFRVVRQSAQ